MRENFLVHSLTPLCARMSTRSKATPYAIRPSLPCNPIRSMMPSDRPVSATAATAWTSCTSAMPFAFKIARSKPAWIPWPLCYMPLIGNWCKGISYCRDRSMKTETALRATSTMPNLCNVINSCLLALWCTLSVTKKVWGRLLLEITSWQAFAPSQIGLSRADSFLVYSKIRGNRKKRFVLSMGVRQEQRRGE